MKSSLSATLLQKNMNAIKSDIENTLTSALTNSAKQSTGLLQFGDSTKTKINSTTKTVTDQVTNILNTIVSDKDIIQNVTVKDATVSAISQDSAQKSIDNQIMNNSIIQGAVSDLSTSVKAEADQSSGKLGNVMIIIAVIIGILILIGVILVLLKKYGKKSGGEEGGIMITPEMAEMAMATA
jgi:flagellar basal body-associated protein FliL